jgi:hypothetical protein
MVPILDQSMIPNLVTKEQLQALSQSLQALSHSVTALRMATSNGVEQEAQEEELFDRRRPPSRRSSVPVTPTFGMLSAVVMRTSPRTKRNAWTRDETMALIEGVEYFGAGKWAEIKELAGCRLKNRSNIQIKDKWPRHKYLCDSAKLAMMRYDSLRMSSSAVARPSRRTKKAWTRDETMALIEGVGCFGVGKWAEIKELAGRRLKKRSTIQIKDKWPRDKYLSNADKLSKLFESLYE